MLARRNGLIEYGRFAASLGLVWFGSQAPGQRIAYIALPFYLVMLSMPSSKGLSVRARQLLVPFVTWSVVFGMLRTALALKANDPPFGWLDWQVLLAGTWFHLWLLPFAFLAASLAPWFQHPLASMGAAWLAALLLVVKGTPDMMPFSEWSFGVIPVLVGIAFYSWGWRLAAITLLGSWLILYLGRPSPDNITILAGTALALVCLSFRIPSTQLSERCSRLSVWIYLSYPFAIFLGQSLRITWFELGLFSVVGSVLLALLLETASQTSSRGKLEF